MHLEWHMLEQEGKHVQDGLSLDDVEIIQDEDEWGRAPGNLVDYYV